MKAKKRYLVVLALLALLLLCHLSLTRLTVSWSGEKKFRIARWRRRLPRAATSSSSSSPEVDPESILDFADRLAAVVGGDGSVTRSEPAEACRMETCFNFTRCRNRPFKVYVYPEEPEPPAAVVAAVGEAPDDPEESNDDDAAAAGSVRRSRKPPRPSQGYAKILEALRGSRYLTADPEQACLLVLSLDTLDRDARSTADFVRNLDRLVVGLPSWNGGQNHVVFNLYAGTYPDYREGDLAWDFGQAILAKASMSDGIYRPHFDVSLPLFHKTHPGKGDGSPDPVGAAEEDASSSSTSTSPSKGSAAGSFFPDVKKHFLAFKGKRYLYGIGSETRNALFHLHNGRDLVLVTTCKHGATWKKYQDERCKEDNAEYERSVQAPELCVLSLMTTSRSRA